MYSHWGSCCRSRRDSEGKLLNRAVGLLVRSGLARVSESILPQTSTRSFVEEDAEQQLESDSKDIDTTEPDVIRTINIAQRK